MSYQFTQPEYKNDVIKFKRMMEYSKLGVNLDIKLDDQFGLRSNNGFLGVHEIDKPEIAFPISPEELSECIHHLSSLTISSWFDIFSSI